MLKKILVGLVVVILLVVVGITVFVASRQNLKFDDTPYPAVEASTDSAVIARGHYIVRNVANCASCHGDTTQAEANAAGVDVALTGGFLFNIPPGKFYVRNITPDPETGIGKAPAKAIARALRSGVAPDGRALLPFMEFQGLSDEDLVAVVSYLESQPPVRNPVPMHQYTTLGKVIKATVFSKPTGPRETPPVQSPRGATVENGRYLVESVGLCGACHTQRNMQTGAFEGPPLGGSPGFEQSHGMRWSPPNITAHPDSGRLGRMTEDEFVARFRAGRVLPHSPMPWQGLSRMEEDDLRAIYRYIKTVPPSSRDVGPSMVELGK
jgi:mono/diheme cytochrome c family protein